MSNKLKKPILFWLAMGVATDAQRKEALSKGAQFRNAHYYDPENEEPASAVMGDVPEGAYFGTKGGSKTDPNADTDQDDENASGGSQDDEDNVEITAKYIGSLLKADLIALAEEEELELTGHELVDELKDMLLEHFELQE